MFFLQRKYVRIATMVLESMIPNLNRYKNQ